jgi:hypothetical protein
VLRKGKVVVRHLRIVLPATGVASLNLRR